MRHLLLPAFLIAGLAAHLAFKVVSADDFVFDPVKTLDLYRTQAMVAEEPTPVQVNTPMLPIAPPFADASSEFVATVSWGF
jgi:hypothetical protein